MSWQRWVALGALLLIVAALFFSWSRRPDAGGQRTSRQDSRREPAAPRGPQPPAQSPSIDRLGDAGVADVGQAYDEEPEPIPSHAGIRQYQSITRYPPATRRLDETSVDLLNPNKRHERRQPLPNRDVNEDLAWEVLYTADRYFIRADEPVTITLALWRDDTPMELQGVLMRASTSTGAAPEDGVTLQVQRDGSTVFSKFWANERWPAHVGEIWVTTKFAAEGLPAQTATLAFYFTGVDRIPARFTGELSDRLVRGDLVIDVSLEVSTPGAYRVEGNLFDANGPLGWARYQGDLPAGAQTVPLVFYGLVFHDAAAKPPFVLRQLRGYRLRRGDSPHREDIPPYGGEYLIAGHYVLSDFRQDVYESPRKQRMLEHYRDALDRGVDLTNPEYTGSEAGD